MGLWLESCQIIKNLIKIIQCLKIYDLWTHSPPLGGCMGGWVGQWVGSCQISKNLINHNVIEIIQFSLKIFDLWSHLWLVGWMDILTFLDFLLKPPQSFTGLLLYYFWRMYFSIHNLSNPLITCATISRDIK